MVRIWWVFVRSSGGKRWSCYSPRSSDGQETTFLDALLQYTALQSLLVALVHFATLLCTGDIALGTECWEYPHLLVPPSLYPPSPSQICHTPIDNIFTPVLSLFPHICGHFMKRVLKESIFWTHLS